MWRNKDCWINFWQVRCRFREFPSSVLFSNLYTQLYHACHFVAMLETFHMIDTCDPGIASWADDGNSFIIKDVKEFSKVSRCMTVRVRTMVTGERCAYDETGYFANRQYCLDSSSIPNFLALWDSWTFILSGNYDHLPIPEEFRHPNPYGLLMSVSDEGNQSFYIVFNALRNHKMFVRLKSGRCEMRLPKFPKSCVPFLPKWNSAFEVWKRHWT